jgi:hypothetical protein
MTGNTMAHARTRVEAKDWAAEYAQLRARDEESPLNLGDLERLGIAAYLAGDEPRSIQVHTRAHGEALAPGNPRQAARSAFWAAFALIGAGDLTQAGGWVARGRRLLEASEQDCVERGYMLLPQAIAHVAARELTTAEATFSEAERIGERFGDADLTSLARQGRAGYSWRSGGLPTARRSSTR